MMMMISDSSLFLPPLTLPEPLTCRGTPLVLSDLPATFGEQLVTMEFKRMMLLVIKAITIIVNKKIEKFSALMYYHNQQSTSLTACQGWLYHQ